MDRIASFSVDHRKIKPCVYISRIDGDIHRYIKWEKQYDNYPAV